MRYKEDWTAVQDRFRAYWARANHERPLVSIAGVRPERIPRDIVIPDSVEARWTDPEWLVRKARAWCGAVWYGGEAYPDFWPNLGPDIFAALLGGDIEFGDDTSWARHNLESWSPQPVLRFDPANPWWRRLVDLHDILVTEARGEFFVGMTDLHAGLDGLVSLRGPEALALDLYDEPEAVKQATWDCFEALKTVYDRLYAMSQRNLGGYSDWLNVWHPGRAFTASCDFIGLISDENYREFVEPELKAQLAWFDAAIFHLDGPAALRHLDALLELKDLDGIQWVYGAGQPTAAAWIPVLKKIQDAGKCVHVSAAPSDLPALAEALRPEGLMLSIQKIPNDMGPANRFLESEARDILAEVERLWRRRP